MRTSPVILLCALALPIAFISRSHAADPLDIWHWRNPRPTAQPLFDVTYGDGEFVAVGAHGTILTSPDGEHWLSQQSGVTEDLCDVVWGDGMYVAVGDYGLILTSPDGRQWTEQFTSVFTDLNAVAYGDGQFVAVGGNTTILSSSDGMQWLECARGQDMLYDVAFGNGRFVAVGGDPVPERSTGGWPAPPSPAPTDPLVLVSTNGLVWRRSETSAYGTLTAIAYGRGRFVTALYRFPQFVGTGAVLTSEDGAAWEEVSWVELGLYAPVRCMAFDDVIGFAAFIGWEFVVGSCYAASLDGRHWHLEATGDSQLTEGVAIRSGTLVAAGRVPYDAPQIVLLMRRPDGTWRNCFENNLPETQRVTFVGDRFFGFNMEWDYAGGYLPWGLASSPDGVFWTPARGPTNASFADVAFADGLYVSVGGNGWVATSTDAINWQPQPAPAADFLSGLVYGAGQFVAVGATGAVWTATDATNWTRHVFADESSLGGLCYGNGVFAALDSRDGTVLTSTNGTEWIHHPTNQPARLIRLRFGDGYFTAVSDGNALFVSTNASQWTPIDCPVVSSYRLDFAAGEGLFVVAGGTWTSSGTTAAIDSSLLTSSDGLTWRERDTGSDYPFYGVCFGANTILASGASAVVVQSDPLVPKAPTLVASPPSEAYVPGRFITLSALASGTSPIQYHWFQDGNLVPGAIESLLPLGRFQTGEAHEYWVVASNALGTATSAPVRVVCGEVPRLELASTPAPLITIGGTPGRSYEVHYADVLSEPPAWQLLTNLVLSASEVQIADPAAASVTSRFYRAQLVP